MDSHYVGNLPIPHEDGSMISPAIDRTIEVIQNYDWHLSVKWIPRDRRNPGDAAFAIMYSQTGNHDAPDYIVMYVETEEDMVNSDEVLRRLAGADNRNGSVELATQAGNDLIKMRQKQQYDDAIAEANELAAAIWKSPKSTYKHNGVKYQ